LIIHEQQELENKKLPYYDKNIGNLVAQYLGFNLFLTLPNRNGENVRVYYNPGYENDHVEVEASDYCYFFSNNEKQIIDSEFDKDFSYIRRSDFKKYQFHIDFNTGWKNDAKIEIQHNFLTMIHRVSSKYKDGKFVELNTEDIKLCKDLNIKYSMDNVYNQDLINKLNEKY